MYSQVSAFMVRVETASSLEVLTWDFHSAEANHETRSLRSGTKFLISIELGVQMMMGRISTHYIV